MKVKLLSLIGIAFLLFSCTYEVFEVDSNELSHITCVADNFIYENAVQTRSAADLSNTENIAFQWSAMMWWEFFQIKVPRSASL